MYKELYSSTLGVYLHPDLTEKTHCIGAWYSSLEEVLQVLEKFEHSKRNYKSE